MLWKTSKNVPWWRRNVGTVGPLGVDGTFGGTTPKGFYEFLGFIVFLLI